MNIGTIVTANAKGQLVIPKKIRDDLGISENQPLNVIIRDGGIHIYPISGLISYEEQKNRNKILAEILKNTQGAWAGDDWPQTEKRRRKIELEASKKRKKAWW